MFTPPANISRIDRSNLALFYPDRLPHTITATSPAGWYVLFAPFISSSAELIYVPTGGGGYLGYTTKPSTSANLPIESGDITTGKCTIAWASVEDAPNSPYKVEDTIGQAQEIIYLSGRASNSVGSDRQVFGLYLQDAWFDRSFQGLAQFSRAIKIIARVRHSPADVLFKLNKVFGYAINLVARELSAYAPQPSYSLAPSGADIGGYQPSFLSLVANSGVLAVVLRVAPPIDIVLRLHLGATRFDTFTCSLPIDDCAIDSIDIFVPANQTSFSLRVILPTENVYTPILHKTQILGWI